MDEQLTPRTAYPLHQLQPGDRFYFSNDKKKKVWELSSPPFETKRLKGKYWVKFANCIDREKYNWLTPEQHKADRIVIFIRHNELA